MRVCLVGLSVLALIFMVKPAVATGDLQVILDAMEKAEATVKDMSFDFVQEISFPRTKEKQHFRGHVIFKKPSRLKILYQEPMTQEITSDGKTIWIYTPEYQQVVEDTWDNWRGKGLLPNNLLNVSHTIKELLERYATSLESQTPDSAWLHFVPREEALQDTKLRIEIDKKNHLPRQTEFLTGDFVSTTKIQNIQLNQEISNRQFRFKIPKGVEVERFH